jgi:hypothetical protein
MEKSLGGIGTSSSPKERLKPDGSLSPPLGRSTLSRKADTFNGTFLPIIKILSQNTQINAIIDALFSIPYGGTPAPRDLKNLRKIEIEA